MEITSGRSMGGGATGRTGVEKSVVSLAALQLEGDTNVSTITGLEFIARPGTVTEGGSTGAKDVRLSAGFIRVVMLAEANDAEGRWRRAKRSDFRGPGREVFDISAHEAFGWKRRRGWGKGRN